VLKKDITYKTFTGETVTDQFVFHLSPGVLLEIEAETPGGMEATLGRMQDTGDPALILNTFKKLITRSIGKVSVNGKQFIQNDEVRDEFLQSNAYSALLLELMKDAEFAATFFNGIMPEGLGELAEAASRPAGPQRERVVAEATPIREEKVISQADAAAMDRDELLAKMKDGYSIQT